MLKKLLTLSLVAVILSVSAFATPTPMVPMTAALADAPATVNATGEALIGDMDILIVTNGASGATVQKYTLGTYNLEVGTEWLLMDVTVGEDWVLNETTMTLQTRVRYPSEGTVTCHVTPLTKEDFDAAKAAAGTSTAVTGLESPIGATTNKNTKSITGSAQKTFVGPTLTSSYYGADNYVDGHLYMAVQYDTIKVRLLNTNLGEWKLTLDGKKIVPADTATVTTAYITGDATEQTIDCEADGTEGLEVVSATKWAFYKMDTGYTYENVNSVSLTVPTYKKNTIVAAIHLYALTEEEWNAATAGGTRTLKVADKQNLFESPFKGKNSFARAKTSEVKTEYTIDLTNQYAEKAKSGVIYLCLGYASNTATDPDSRTGVIYTPTLKITGTRGEYTAPAVTTLDDSYLAWNGANYSFYTTATSGKAMLIAATFNDTTMVDAEAITLDASTATNGVISGTTTLTAGETLKVYLWEDGTLTPIKNVIEF